MDDPIKTRLTGLETEATSEELRIRHHLWPWLLDIGAFVISLSCVIAILAIIYHYDGQAEPTWHGVTLNTVIGYLAQIAQVCLAAPLGNAISQLKWTWYWNETKPRGINDFQLYDAASRGPLGSVSMLPKLFRWPLTSLGAIVTIAALVIHPFLQTIPTTGLRWVPSSQASNVSRATGFLSFTYSADGANAAFFGNPLALDLSAKAAVYAGLYNYVPSVSPVCPTGNCKWSDYTSLGACSACQNVSKLITSTWDEYGFDNPGYEYSLPNGMNIESTALTMELQSNLPTMSFGLLQNYSIVDTTEMSYRSGDTEFSIRPPSTFECMLYFCVRTMAGNVFNGTFTETVLWTFPNTSTSVEDAQNGIWPPPGDKGPAMFPSVSDASEWGGEGQTSITMRPPGSSELFSIDNTTFSIMRNYLQSTLNGDISSDSTQVDGNYDVSQIVNEVGISKVMDRIGASLTHYIRTASSDVANGTTLVTQTYVIARWRWAAFPLIVLLFAFVFIIATMISSMTKGVPTWRSSALPSLVYTLDDVTASTIASYGPRLAGLEKAADRFDMAMARDGIWKLEGTKGIRTERSVSDRMKAFWRIPRMNPFGHEKVAGSDQKPFWKISRRNPFRHEKVAVTDQYEGT